MNLISKNNFIERQHGIRRQEASPEALVKTAIVFICFCYMGFPGKYADIISGGLNTFCEYGVFTLEILLMLSCGSSKVYDFQVINLKRKYIPVYFMLLVYFVDSMLVSRYPKLQIITCLRFSVMVLFALWLSDQYSVEQLLEVVQLAQCIFVIVQYGFLILFPGMAFGHESGGNDFIGLFETKNNCAQELALGIIVQVLLYLIKRKHGRRVSQGFIFLLVAQLILMLLCNARGAILSMSIPIVYILFLEPRNRIFKSLPIGIVYIIGSVGFIIFSMTLLPLAKPILDLLGKDITLTGRTLLWKRILSVITQSHTFTGYGFGMFWRNASAVAKIHTGFQRNTFFGTMMTGSHNEILELWLNVGLIGLAAYFIAVLGSTVKVHLMPRDQYIFVSTYLIWYMMITWTERSSIFTLSAVLFYVTLGVAASKPVARKKSRQEWKYQSDL